jgi:hypothetical protein
MASPSMDNRDHQSNIFAAQRIIGTVRAEISSLQFIPLPPFQPTRRQEDSRIVDYLAGVFERTAIRRYDPSNVIRALITPAELRKALKVSGVTQTILTSPAPDGSLRLLKTGPGQKLSCIEGLHRTKAAQKILAEDDCWWTIKLYLSDCKGTYAGIHSCA